jgi:membrane protease YdiL (CAAX protease family)
MSGHLVSEMSASSVFIITLLTAVFGYLAYLYFSRPFFVKKVFRKTPESEKLSVRKVLFQRAAGVVFLGLFPGLITFFALNLRFRNYGMALKFKPADFFWTAGAGIGAFLVSLIVSKVVDNYKIYPQIRVQNWGWPLILKNGLSWMAYLLAYEFLFRGIVLYSSVKAAGYWPAILLNVFLYALAHWPKGIKEVLGAIPFGIVLCLITLETGAMWAAFFVHVVLALSGDHFSLLSNPEMHYSFGKIKNDQDSID